MTNVEFKHGRDYAVVTGAENVEDAFYAACDFVHDVNDPDCDYAINNVLNEDDRADDGSYTFPVKCYDK